jgi:hypothetical protein
MALLLGVVGFFFVVALLVMIADKVFNWEVRLPRKPTVRQQLSAMALEFFGKLTLIFGVLFAGFILWQALSAQ